MFSTILKRVRPQTPNAAAINTLTRNVKSLRDMKPTTNVYGVMGTPWGQSLLPPADALIVAYTDSSGIPSATNNNNGSMTLGVGTAYPAFPVLDGSTVSGLDCKISRGTTDEAYNTPAITVYNLASNSDGAVGGNHWIIAARIYNIWIVIWEECP